MLTNIFNLYRQQYGTTIEFDGATLAVMTSTCSDSEIEDYFPTANGINISNVDPRIFNANISIPESSQLTYNGATYQVVRCTPVPLGIGVPSYRIFAYRLTQDSTTVNDEHNRSQYILPIT